jgi:hypothetical protein
MNKPYCFVPPPLFSDITLTTYREDLGQILAVT